MTLRSSIAETGCYAHPALIVLAIVSKHAVLVGEYLGDHHPEIWAIALLARVYLELDDCQDFQPLRSHEIPTSYRDRESHGITGVAIERAPDGFIMADLQLG